MVEEFTKEQKTQLKTWAEQRDILLSGNSILRIEEEKLQKINKDLADANSDIERRMNIITGRIEELKIKERELPPFMLKEVAFLESKKSTLESEIINLGKMIDVLKPQKFGLESDIEKALVTFGVVKEETILLDAIVDRVTTVSKSNTDKINLLVSNLAVSLEEIIAVNKKNVFETNVVIEKLPVILMELQKHGLIKNRQGIIKNKD